MKVHATRLAQEMGFNSYIIIVTYHDDPIKSIVFE